MNCRHCKAPLNTPFLDLGTAPPSNAYLTTEALQKPETWFPLRVMVCERCWLVQTEDFAGAEELFSAEYAYFSSFSDSWLDHAHTFVQDMITRFNLGCEQFVVEVAANDGYLLQYVRQAGIPCLGIEPTASTARAARLRGIPIVEKFFGHDLASELLHGGKAADLLVANNVLAHVPDINDFVGGFAILLKPEGVATFEFPHLMNLVAKCQFDTVYHEHYSYLSLTAVQTIFAANGLTLFDVEQLPTHGGSLRIFAQRSDTGRRQATSRVASLLREEKQADMTSVGFYSSFQTQAERIKHDLLRFLLDAKARKIHIAAYGAAAKGNTLINFSGIRPDLLPYVVDRNPAKQWKFLPGSRIPIVDENHLRQQQPDLILILPWNLTREITTQLAYCQEWGCSFFTAIPNLYTIMP